MKAGQLIPRKYVNQYSTEQGRFISKMTPRESVQSFLDNCFIPGSLSLTECPVVPGGVIVKDKCGYQMLFFWDIEEQCVMGCKPGELAKRQY